MADDTSSSTDPKKASTTPAVNKPGRYTPPKDALGSAASGAAGAAGVAGGAARAAAASRGETYVVKETGRWVAPLMFALLLIGGLMIVLNYMDLLPGPTSNWWLLGGMGCLVGALVVATQLR
jgi:hypothetical protein